MTVLMQYVLYDSLSERIVQSFFCPNERFAKKQVDLFLKRNPDVERSDFKLFEFSEFSVPDNFNDLVDCKEISLNE